MNQWKDHKDIPSYCNLVIINRPGYEVVDWKKNAGDYGFLAEEEKRIEMDAKISNNEMKKKR